MFDAQLIEKGIRLRQTGTGNHCTTCPQCSHMRKQANRKKRCLSVTIKSDGVVFHCHNCGWSGGISDRQVEREDRRRAEPVNRKQNGRDWRRRVRSGAW